MPHEHNVFDQDPHFTIDADTRIITYASGTKVTVVQFDHNSEMFTFDLPKVIDGHDMTLCDTVRVHYINSGTPNRSLGTYDVTDLQVHPNKPDTVVCTWLLSKNATVYDGTLIFALEFSCTEDGVVTYSWNTIPFKNVTVSPGINNTEIAIEENIDIISQLKELISDIGAEVSEINATLETLLDGGGNA